VESENYKLKHTLQVGVSVRNESESDIEGKTNQPRNKADEHGGLFYRGSVLKNLVPVEVVTNTRVSFNPFPLSNGHLDRVSLFLNLLGHLDPARTNTHLGVSFFDYKSLEKRNEKGRRQSKRQELKRTQNLSFISH
jgi:hypothetical protein